MLCYCDPVKRKTNPCTVAQGVTPLSKIKPQYMSLLCNRNQTSQATIVLQIHGSTSDPDSILLNQEAYKALFNLNPAYSNFMRTVMASRTLLYIGASTDLFGDLRSELMTMQGQETKPRAYMIASDTPKDVREFHLNHEGLHVLPSWEASQHGYGVLDRYLEGIVRCSNPAVALSHCKVLLFSPQSASLSMPEGRSVIISSDETMHRNLMPAMWFHDSERRGVICNTGPCRQVDNWLLVRLRNPDPDWGWDEKASQDMTRMRRLLGPALDGRPFFIPRAFVSGLESKETHGRREVWISERLLELIGEQSQKFPNHDEDALLMKQMGMDPNYWHYLSSLGLEVLDSKCYAVKVRSRMTRMMHLRVLPSKLIQRDRSSDTVTVEVSEANQDKTMDYTMETVEEQLRHLQSHSVFTETRRCWPLATAYNPFTVLSDITSVDVLTSSLHPNDFKAFIIINAANLTTMSPPHLELFVELWQTSRSSVPCFFTGGRPFR
eukprot:NODE_24_length_3390_cov_61.461538_g22_i0.p1 GENE.NODE_24_length_3390_cov_61.461538_g22_i0~~NODE_24_length_3390_cov_61.461538_g22_i0.p1  ORF type:complete len:493 (+),score=106.20 NODE_24_length_3390_cov_61.461538_g22_i0:1415-2893(+)